MPQADFNLEGKTAIVTGSSRGIGEAIARGLAENGATVVLASRKQEDLGVVAESINSEGKGKAIAIACHTGKPEQIGVVLFGRSYNAFADEAHMGIPHKFASRGIPILPIDFLPLGEDRGHLARAVEHQAMLRRGRERCR